MEQLTDPKDRILLGPGPSSVNTRVIRAMTLPIMGYLDPTFVRIMDELVELLRRAFQTSNSLTLPISGTGSSGMEAALVNILEPGDTAVIGTHGLFGQRMVDIAKRCGANVVTVESEWGKPLDEAKLEEALQTSGTVKVLAIVHVETSTGVVQPIDSISALAHRYGALSLVDAVTSLGGVDLRVDEWEIDICYSASQKCVGAPPGLSPITLSDRAVEALNRRNTPVQSFYLDLQLLEKYWLTDRVYHHTASMPMIYALREALAIVMEEGLNSRFERHTLNARALRAGLKAIGLQPLAPDGFQAPPLTAVNVPENVDEAKIRRTLLAEYGIEIGAGFGPLAGKIWRIGLMGESSRTSNVLILLESLETLLLEQGYEFGIGDSLVAAHKVFSE